VEYQERNGIYPIWGCIQDSNGKKNPLVLLKSLIMWGSTQRKILIDGLWSIFKGIYLFFIFVEKATPKMISFTLLKNIIEIIH